MKRRAPTSSQKTAADKAQKKWTSSAAGSRSLRVKVGDKKERTVSSRRWLERQLNDPYVQRSKDLGYRSRAAFKILEIDEKFKFFARGKKVIDLGAAPGGWSQVAAAKVHSTNPAKGGRVIAVDLQEIAPIPGVVTLQMDFTLSETQSYLLTLLDGPVDIVLSDMAAPACGMTDVDHLRIMNLVESAFAFAKEVLAEKGVFVAKVLRGGTEAELLKQLKQSFTRVMHFKPPSSRKDSAEMFVVATGFKAKNQA